MNVTVTQADLATVSYQGSVIVVTGTDESGKRVRFAGDHRPMDHMLDALASEPEVSCEVESWQVLSTAPVG